MSTVLEKERGKSWIQKKERERERETEREHGIS